MMRTHRWLAMAVLICPSQVAAQSSSMYLRAARQKAQGSGSAAPGTADAPPTGAATVQRIRPLNPELENASLIAVKTKPPHEFRVHDLVTVIVREQKSYESDSRLETSKEYEVESKIDEFFRFINGHLGAASFTDGRPNIDYEYESELRGEGDAQREDRLTFRITAEIIDIKPNGLLVLAGQQHIIHNEEEQIVAFSGTCRSVDVTADNTILSTQIFNQQIHVDHKGAVRDAAKRGWLTRLVDWLGPF